MITHHSLNLLQKAINKALHLDETMPDKLRALEGKVIQLIILPLKIEFFIRFYDGEMVLQESAAAADTVIESSPLGFLRLSLTPADKTRTLFQETVQLSGDMELAQQFKKLVDEIEIDWEGHLARLTGDVVAYQIGSVVRGAQAFKTKLTASLCMNVSEYLQEELRYFPPQEELQDFYTDVDVLVDDTARLAAKIQSLAVSHDEKKVSVARSNNRLLAEPAAGEKEPGVTEHRTGVSTPVNGSACTQATQLFSPAGELCKKSNKKKPKNQDDLA